MVSTRFVTLLTAAAAAVSAAPVAPADVPAEVTALPSNITEEADRSLRNGELVVFGASGRTHVVTEDTWNLLLKTMNILPEPPAIDEEWLNFKPTEVDEVSHNTTTELNKRDCSGDIQMIIDNNQRFVDWDVQMSPVVIGAGSKGIDITIAKYWSVSNSIAVSAGLDFGLVKDRLKSTLGINYSKTWTTQQGYLIRGTVDDGYTGVVVSRPWTNRRYGRTYQGCPGNLRQTGTFMADSHEEGSYEGVSWVGGAITACLKAQRSIPLTRCQGSGEFR
ncbi:hypothetical protein CGRA01v4_09367 [Colletotrichum graminicola]|uniref:Celp0028 effector like protein n=1 Tax=Colletotrichum graminicola (strain M1.001 / M2 / FGSC 10212) TaxID=645133 RepID=E3QPB1_COLGM|nr:uncharacterized protein GLRG_07843 [Colletotrichum graminicola M1.001]EFQ32699.1 hypothetical protein GLRG_07843 [Colletotrichum graminicola M1.001]WDK18082.1 hypothetical protein CGRA01v4_09367 [Colletotrichum graminicola]